MCSPLPIILYRHGVRAPIPQTSGVLIEEETPPSELHPLLLTMLINLLSFDRGNKTVTQKTA